MQQHIIANPHRAENPAMVIEPDAITKLRRLADPREKIARAEFGANSRCGANRQPLARPAMQRNSRGMRHE